MILWVLTLYVFLMGASLLFRGLKGSSSLFSSFFSSNERAATLQVVEGLQHWIEKIDSGLVPDSSDWEWVRSFASPWGVAITQSLESLRENGARLLPALRRFRDLAQRQLEGLEEARNQSGQAWVQGMGSLILIPVLSALLYFLLPDLQGEQGTWWTVSLLCMGWAMAGGLWILKLSEEARWGGLPISERPWVLYSLISCERILALIRSGLTPDWAWSKMIEDLQKVAPELARLWGVSLWGQEEKRRGNDGMAGRISQAGEAIRKSIQVGLMEGRGCAEKIEILQSSLQLDISLRIEGELKKLPHRSLQPLFICIAPSILILLGMSLVLVFPEF